MSVTYYKQVSTFLSFSHQKILPLSCVLAYVHPPQCRPLQLTVIMHLSTGDTTIKAVGLFFQAGCVLASQGRGTSSDPSKSDQEEDFVSDFQRLPSSVGLRDQEVSDGHTQFVV